MKIKSLTVENFKRIRTVYIETSGTTIRICGRNAQGKSSTLDAIAAAFGGTTSCPDRAIREGETRARILVELPDGLRLERRFTRRADGGEDTSVQVLGADGVPLPSPQGVLDRLLGRIGRDPIASFDPLAFVRAEPRQQVELLRRLTGLDFRKLDAERAGAYEARTVANRLAKEAEARVERGLPGPGEPVAIADLLAEQRAARKAMQDRRDLELRSEDMLATLTQLDAQIGDLERKLLTARQDRDRIAKSRNQMISALLLTPEPPDLDAIDQRILAAQSHNEAITAKQRRIDESARQAKEASAAQKRADELTARIAAIDAEKERSLASAKLPLPGLGFDESGVSFQGLPLSQASGAEQLRVGVAIAAALKPPLGVVLIRDGSLLDDDSMAALDALAVEYDVQPWVERVSEDPGGIVIRDGEVAAAPVRPEIRTDAEVQTAIAGGAKAAGE